MAFLKLYKKKLKHNFDFLHQLFTENDLDWGAVTKLFCGNELYLKEVINLGFREIHDSRISNLKKVKEIDSTVKTCYIKPPAKRSIPDIVRYADMSMNTEYYTLKLLSEEAKRQDKVHKAIIMVETGDLREGVMGDHLVDFYAKVFELPNIQIEGIGTNLNCLHGVMPSRDKLIQLSLYMVCMMTAWSYLLRLLRSQKSRKYLWVKWLQIRKEKLLKLMNRSTDKQVLEPF
jgi:predicted amino acid racemase